jgi:hypothetical protein
MIIEKEGSDGYFWIIYSKAHISSKAWPTVLLKRIHYYEVCNGKDNNTILFKVPKAKLLEIVKENLG